LSLVVGLAFLCVLVAGAVALIVWAGDVLIDACAVAALGSGFALAAWQLLGRSHLRGCDDAETATGEPAGVVTISQSVSLILIAWGAALPLLTAWWANRSSQTFAIAAGAIGVVATVEYLRRRALRRHDVRVRAEPHAIDRTPDLGLTTGELAGPESPRWRWRVVVLALLVSVSAGFGFSTWVGFHVRSDHQFNWELFAIVGTAIGTSLLALATGFLGLVTTEDVQASREIARTGREDQEARTRPILLVEKVELTVMSHGPTDVGIIVRNAGLGAAVRGVLQLRYVAGVTALVEEVIYATSLVSGETKSFRARVTPSQAIPNDWRHSDWSVSGVFLDAGARPHGLIDGQPEEPSSRVTVTDPPAALSL
jgi:hypothetical protein